jgi:hypothetical protein
MGRYDWPAPPRGEDDPGGRARYLTRLRPTIDPTTIAPLVPKKSTRRRTRAVPHNAPAGNTNLWIPIGPSVMTNGQAGGDPNVAGRIRDLIVEPRAGLRMYAASATGGVWFSPDKGVTWTPLDDFQESDRIDVGNISAALACGAVHVRFGAAVNGSQDEVWVGTGEQTLTSDGLASTPGGNPDGSPGGAVAGIGFLHRDPAVGPGWTVVKGATAAADPDTLRGEAFYRIAADPKNDRQLVAGTTKGLYLLPVGGSWRKIASFPAAVDMQPLDVVLTRLTAPDRVRIWVGVSTGVQVAEFAGAPATAINPATLAFRPVELPNIRVAPPLADGSPPGGTRVQLATDGTKVYVLGRRAPLAGESNPPAHAWQIDATAAFAAAPAPALRATELTGMRADLFMSADDQSRYDMCIAVHPTVPGRLYVGGAAVKTTTGYNGAIYRCELAGTVLTPTMIGEGVHPDVHVLRVSPTAPPPPPPPASHDVWAGCDGGLFHSDSDGDPGTFVNCNDGLAVLEPGYVASHPTNPGIVVAGFQDNGTAIRVGDGVWEQKFGGDGGGVVFDPDSTKNRFFVQNTAGLWESSDNTGIAPVLRRRAKATGKLKTSETVESEASLFYTGADAVAYGGDTHLTFGTDRVWYSRDWGRSWMTLPTATDPRGGKNPNLAQDVLKTIGIPGTFSDTTAKNRCCDRTVKGSAVVGQGIIAVKFSRLPEAPVPADNLTLRVVALYSFGLVWFTGTRTAGTTGAFTWARPATFVQQAIHSPRSGVGTEQADFTAGRPLAFLPAASAVSDVAVHDPTLGTLGSCYVTTTGASVDFGGGVVVPHDTLYFFDGKDKWFPTGLRLNLPANGTWTGTRVTAPALGVVVDPDNKNIVYVATSVGVVRGVLTISGPVATRTYKWAWSQFMNGLPEAPVHDLSIRKYGGVTLLRAALQARGVWETDIATPASTPLTYLRAYRTDTRRLLPTQLAGPTVAGDTDPAPYDSSPDIVIDTGAARAVPPTEAELAKISPAGSATAAPRAPVSNRHPKVHVLVHHRAGAAAPPAQVRVALIRHAIPANGVVPLGGLWPVLVGAALNGTSPALPAADGWTKAAATLTLSPSAPVEPRLPRAVTFDVDLSGDAAGSAVLLLAVVFSTTNRITAADLRLTAVTQAATADQLVMSSPHVAARSILIR